MTLEIRVKGSPSRCPYCRDSLGDVRKIVACALCGTRHHADCRTDHGRCAVCSSTELLVYKKTDEPLVGPGLNVIREADRVEYRWRLISKTGLALAPITGFLRLDAAELAFLAAAGRRFYEVRAAKPRVGDATHVGRRLLLDVDAEEHTVATESIGYTLSAAEVGVLALGIEAWRHR